jgi:hypothetical protein
VTQEELKKIGITLEQLSAMSDDVSRRVKARTLHFDKSVLTDDRIKKLAAIRTIDGQIDLKTIDSETARFIKVIFKTAELAESEPDPLPLA